MNSIPRLETERTVLTLAGPDGAAALLEFYERNRAHLAPWEPERAADYYSLESVQREIEKSVEDFHADRAVRFVALDADEARVVATCNFSNISRGVFQACSLGYAVDREREGTALMAEVLSRAIRYMFDEKGLHRIMANYMPRNERSGRLLARLGFEKEGHARDYLRIGGRWEDHVLTSLINPDWVGG